MFDPYHKWLGIPPGEQPPSHYRLLGVSPMERDEDVISASADQRMNYLSQFTNGEHGADAQKLMDQIARASMCLLDPNQRKSYDATLRTQAQFHSAPTAIVSRPKPEVVVDTGDESYKPRGKDRSVLYFWVWHLTLLTITIVLTVIIIIRRQQANDGNPADANALAATDNGDATTSDDDDGEDNSQGSSFLSNTNDASLTGNTMPGNRGSGAETSENSVGQSGSQQSGRQGDQQPNFASRAGNTAVDDPMPNAEMPVEPEEEAPPQQRLSQPPGLTVPSDVETVQQLQADWAEYLGWSVEHENIVEMPLILIPPGEFEMGGWTGNDRTAQTQPVRLTQPFYIGRREVTQVDWRDVMGAIDPPSYYSFTGGGSSAVRGVGTNRFPVESVSWFEAIEFCNALSRLELLDEYYEIEYDSNPDEPMSIGVKIVGGTGYRLPTEAEWEYAAKAGSVTAFDFGEADIASADSFNSLISGISRTDEVEGYRPNAFGLYDMHGNVWEWCHDWFDQFPVNSDSPFEDPDGPEASPYSSRLLRGGSHITGPARCTSISRAYAEPHETRTDIGFRVVRTLEVR